MPNSEKELSVLREARGVVRQAIEDGNNELEQRISGLLFQLAFGESDLPESSTIPNVKKQTAIVTLAQDLQRLDWSKNLDIEGRDQPELFRTEGFLWPDVLKAGIFYVGPSFTEEYKRRPDSVIAEMLFKMSSAVLVDGNLRKIGRFRTMGQMGKVIVDYLRTFPESAPMTDEQRGMIKFYDKLNKD